MLSLNYNSYICMKYSKTLNKKNKDNIKCTRSMCTVIPHCSPPRCEIFMNGVSRGMSWFTCTKPGHNVLKQWILPAYKNRYISYMLKNKDR